MSRGEGGPSARPLRVGEGRVRGRTGDRFMVFGCRGISAVWGTLRCDSSMRSSSQRAGVGVRLVPRSLARSTSRISVSSRTGRGSGGGGGKERTGGDHRAQEPVERFHITIVGSGGWDGFGGGMGAELDFRGIYRMGLSQDGGGGRKVGSDNLLGVFSGIFSSGRRRSFVILENSCTIYGWARRGRPNRADSGDVLIPKALRTAGRDGARGTSKCIFGKV